MHPQIGDGIDLKETYLGEIERYLFVQVENNEKIARSWWDHMKTEHVVLSLFFASGYDSRAASRRSIYILCKVAA